VVRSTWERSGQPGLEPPSYTSARVVASNDGQAGHVSKKIIDIFCFSLIHYLNHKNG
jgi:hypothetical protein